MLFPLVSTQYIEEMKLFLVAEMGGTMDVAVVTTVASITERYDVVSSVQLFVLMYVERY